MPYFRPLFHGKSRKKVVLGRSSEIDLKVGREKSTSTDRLRPTLNTICQTKLRFAKLQQCLQFLLWVKLLCQTQGAGKGVDPPTKVPMPETPIFGCGPTWGTTFTKVILLRMAEALYCF